ncbi:MAG: hypothetical protein KDK70_30395, partial [Myxococcales bacterium]|nr:hypothetical protein [Myxococcales bacterium]
MKHVLVSLGLLAALVSACSDSTCVEVTHPPVTDPDAPLVIGGTYGDALATVVGERSGTLRWLESSAHVRGFPSPGEARITVTIHEPSMAEQVDLERDGREGLYPERHVCPDGLEAELQLDL